MPLKASNGLSGVARLICLLLVCAQLGMLAHAQDQASVPAPFVHPGLLHTRSDLERLRQRIAVGQEPWKSGCQRLRNDQASRSDWLLHGPFEVVTCVPGAFHGTKQAADKLRPEGAAWGCDHPGFGTVLFSLPTKFSPAWR